MEQGLCCPDFKGRNVSPNEGDACKAPFSLLRLHGHPDNEVRVAVVRRKPTFVRAVSVTEGGLEWVAGSSPLGRNEVRFSEWLCALVVVRSLQQLVRALHDPDHLTLRKVPLTNVNFHSQAFLGPGQRHI